MLLAELNMTIMHYPFETIYKVIQLVIKIIFIIFTVVTLVLIIPLIFKPIPSSYNIHASTERVAFTCDQESSTFYFQNATIYIDNKIDSIAEGSIDVISGTGVTIERKSNGPLIIQFYNSSNDSIGVVKSSNDILFNIGTFTEIIIDDIQKLSNQGNTIFIPIEGAIDVVAGRQLGNQNNGTTSILRGGTVTLIDKSVSKFFGDNNFYIEKKFELEIGDLFEIKEPLSKTFGFIQIDERPAMNLFFKVDGKKGVIRKSGPMNIEIAIKTSIINRLLSDHFYQLISLIFGGIAIVLSIISSLIALKKNSHDSP